MSTTLFESITSMKTPERRPSITESANQWTFPVRLSCSLRERQVTEICRSIRAKGNRLSDNRLSSLSTGGSAILLVFLIESRIRLYKLLFLCWL